MLLTNSPFSTYTRTSDTKTSTKQKQQKKTQTTTTKQQNNKKKKNKNLTNYFPALMVGLLLWVDHNKLEKKETNKNKQTNKQKMYPIIKTTFQVIMNSNIKDGKIQSKTKQKWSNKKLLSIMVLSYSVYRGGVHNNHNSLFVLFHLVYLASGVGTMNVYCHM